MGQIVSANSPLRKLNIYLENNSITNITNSTFVIDCELNSLYLEPLGRPQILTIDPYTLATLRSKTFSLAWNTMSSELWKLFFIGIGNSKIEELILHNAYIEDIDPHYYAPMQNRRRSLTTLDLKKNPLATLQSGLFLDLLFLQELDLSYCELFQIESKTFEGLQRLKTLYLQGNKLHGLPRKVFQNSGELATILLEGNKLRYLEHDLFVNSSKLQNLTLAGNRLSGFNRSTFEPIFTNLISIDISNNEFVCTCNLKWLPLWLSGSITLLDENDTRCSPASLEELRESPLLSFKPAELCGTNVFLYTLLPLGIICITVLLIFAYRHRWFLKCKIFLLKLAVIGYREIPDARDFDDYEFHVNIMFAEEDEEWVRDRFRPVLEELLPEYERNLYGDDDLPLGMHYYDAVHYVVEMSYKTIVLVSRAAIKDNWFIIKFRTAADQVNDTQIENMVVIFLEDIPDDELPFLVRLYLSDRKPYLSWEEEEWFQEYFWQKLTKMLTINLRCNNVTPPE
eukprot:XP_011672074.1 PREDICTED: toll-like receptor 4 [Strongylocentrotus purpuratus]